MAMRTQGTRAKALATARDRRRALDAARDERDQRIEEATAEALLALQVRMDAERDLESASVQLGTALKALVAEEVSIRHAAELLELEASDVRRLVKTASSGGVEPTGYRPSVTRTGTPVRPDALDDRVAGQAG